LNFRQIINKYLFEEAHRDLYSSPIQHLQLFRDCRNKGEGFEFLGYRFEAGQKICQKEKYVEIKRENKGATPCNCGLSLDIVIERVNRTLK
jgi:hypothetical protein